MAQANNPVGSVKKTITILEALKRSDGAGVTELSTQLALSKGAIHNHLSTLEEEGFVVNEGGEYELGLRFFELGEYTKNRLDVLPHARPEVDKIAEETGEITTLMVEENGRGIYVYQASGSNALSLDTQTGVRVYLHNCALGKAVLAFLPESRVEEIIAQHGLPAATSNTITDAEELFAEFEEIRDREVAYDREERAEGVNCVAAPIRRNTGEVLGSISVAGPKSRITGDLLHSDLPDMLRNSASVIGINTSYS